MNLPAFQTLANAIVAEVRQLLPRYLEDATDFAIAQGKCSLVIMNAAGDGVSAMFGEVSRRQRETAQIAWKKAHQVWLTGYSTERFETLVYSGQLDDSQFGLPRPEFIGWLGGVEARTSSGERLILAFSGMRGEQDVAIVKEAASRLGSFSLL